MNFIAKTALAALVTFGAVAASQAQDIRIIAPRFSGNRLVGLYEVVEGSNTGGRFVNRSYTVGGVRFDGFTDRISKGELFGTLILGTGRANAIGIIADGRILSQLPNVTIPFARFDWASMSSTFRNAHIFVNQNGRTVTKRLPIGTRP